MLSDVDDEEPVVKPVFKARAKGKLAKGKRRIREVDEETNNPHEQPVSLFGSLKVSVAPEPSLKVSRWSRYQVLSGVADRDKNEEKLLESPHVLHGKGLSISERGQNIEGLEDDVPIIDEEHVALSFISPAENKAYTRLEIPQNTNTFVLKESHFRDTPQEFIPLEQEYADKFGNVLDEEEQWQKGKDLEKLEGDDGELDVDVETAHESLGLDKITHGQMLGGRRDLGDMYDLEVSLEDSRDTSGEITPTKVQDIPDAAGVLKHLLERLAQLDMGIKLKEERRHALKESLADLQKQRHEAIATLECWQKREG